MKNYGRYNRRRRLRRLKTNILYFPFAFMFRAVYGPDFRNIVYEKVVARNAK